MMSHPLHSPNLTEAELVAYYSTPLPPRDRHSLIEASNHNPVLINFLEAPVEGRLIRELVKTVTSIIRIPEDSGPLPTPPVTPVKGTFAQQSQSRLHVHQPSNGVNPADVPLERFIVILVKESRIRVRTLAYALLVLDRLKEKLPPMAQGMACTRHRIFLASLIVASKYLNDSTPKNKHWAQYSRYIFDVGEITLMEKQMLGLLDFDLRVTEDQIFNRLQQFINLRPERKSRVRQEAVKKVQENAVARQQHIPLTPITPSSTQSAVKLNAEPKAEAVSIAKRELKRLEAAKNFVLQPVPSLKKRSEKGVIVTRPRAQASRMTLSSSQSAPSKIEYHEETKPVVVEATKSAPRPFLALPAFPPILCDTDTGAEMFQTCVEPARKSVAMPITRSFSSDGVLQGAGSLSMNLGQTLSSTVSISMTNSSSISTSASTSGSEVATPGDRPQAWSGEVLSSASQQGRQSYFQAYKYEDHTHKPPANRRRGSDPVVAYTALPVFGIDGGIGESTRVTPNNSSLMNKLLGVGRALSPTRRIGHGVKGGERKVSTATIVPDEVRIERQ